MASLPPTIDVENFSNTYHLRVELEYGNILPLTNDPPSVNMQMDIIPLIISVPPFSPPNGFAPTDLSGYPIIEFVNSANE